MVTGFPVHIDDPAPDNQGLSPVLKITRSPRISPVLFFNSGSSLFSCALRPPPDLPPRLPPARSPGAANDVQFKPATSGPSSPEDLLPLPPRTRTRHAQGPALRLDTEGGFFASRGQDGADHREGPAGQEPALPAPHHQGGGRRDCRRARSIRISSRSRWRSFKKVDRGRARPWQPHWSFIKPEAPRPRFSRREK